MYKKEFLFTFENGLHLKNIDDENGYILEKIDFFSNHKNYSSKECLLSFFQEILDIIEYDLKTSKFDFSCIANTVGFSFNKKEMIKWYDIIHTMGHVFLNVFDYNGNKISNVLEGENGAISTSDMFIRAYNELISCKESPSTPPAYGATLILATLFESDLKTHVEIYYAKCYLLKLKELIDKECVHLDDEEKDLFNFLSNELRLSQIPVTKTYDAIGMKRLRYKLFIKYGVIQSEDKQIEKILLSTSTLNEFLRNQYFREISDTRFINMANEVFGADNLNLRNNLAHCNFERMNYYSLSTTSILYVFYTIVANEYFLK